MGPRFDLDIERGYFTDWVGGSTIFLLILIIIALIALIMFLSAHFKKKNNPEYIRFLDILKEKYVKNELSADEYRERSMLIDDDYWADADIPAIMTLKERYAKCEIDSRKYIERRNSLRENKNHNTNDI